jgi:ABC-type glycerol-3-phosphate transport system substrate-binding protein
MAVALLIDGKVPFSEAENILLPRVWRDATDILRDERGNDLIPEQEEVLRFQTGLLKDDSLFTNEAFGFLLTGGNHRITIKNIAEPLLLSGVTLCAVPQTDSDAQAAEKYKQQGLREVPDVLMCRQAEDSYEKSNQSIFPQYDRTSPATQPYHVSKIRRNVLGKYSWFDRGDWVSWVIEDVPEDGLYYITLKYLQNEKIGLASYRTMYVNGKIPSQSFVNIGFGYDVQWQNQTIQDSSGKSCPVFLKKGRNEIRMEAALGDYASVYEGVDSAVYQMRELYLRMVMICGSTPDRYRDYNLEKEIPELLSTMQDAAKVLTRAADEMDRKNGTKSAQTAPLRRAVGQLESMMKDPKTIPNRISNFRDTISALSDWMYSGSEQPLTLDYILVHSADAVIPSASATVWETVRHWAGSFLASFTEDYSDVNTVGKSAEAIHVWANMGRDQVQVLRDLITDQFTPETGIPVKISLVQSGFVEAILADAGPDIAVGIARGQPINLASRGVLADLSRFDSFRDVASRFGDTALVPYTLNNGVYALPNTQTFFMMFYRKDIFSSLNLSVPNTWDEVSSLIARLQKRNMTFGLPYSVLSAATAVDTGMGAKDMFSVLLLQKGGTFYKDDGRSVALDSQEASEAFRQWCDYYAQYGFDLVYDFYTRFRYGEMPIGIANYDVYNMLMSSAPEIRGRWEMAPVPGTMDKNGNINRSVGGAGTATVLFKSAENPENCWRFMDWWSTAGAQTDYAAGVENVLGPAGRYYTANIEAFSNLSWTKQELAVIAKQRESVQEIMEVPGSYFVSRCLDNAFRAVLFDKKIPLETLDKEVKNINREIERKRRELDLE